jgi:hypothetical protein
VVTDEDISTGKGRDDSDEEGIEMGALEIDLSSNIIRAISVLSVLVLMWAGVYLIGGIVGVIVAWYIVPIIGAIVASYMMVHVIYLLGSAVRSVLDNLS